MVEEIVISHHYSDPKIPTQRWVATNQLRFITNKRIAPGRRGGVYMHILQQLWYDGDSTAQEWRDVPTIEV